MVKGLLALWFQDAKKKGFSVRWFMSFPPQFFHHGGSVYCLIWLWKVWTPRSVSWLRRMRLFHRVWWVLDFLQAAFFIPFIERLGGGFNFFEFSPLPGGYYGNLTNIFQVGWNHQKVLDVFWEAFFSGTSKPICMLNPRHWSAQSNHQANWSANLENWPTWVIQNFGTGIW